MSNKQCIEEIEHIKGCLRNSSPYCGDFTRVMELLDSKIEKIKSLPEQSRYEVAMEVLKEFLEQDTRISEKQCARFEEWLEEKNNS